VADFGPAAEIVISGETVIYWPGFLAADIRRHFTPEFADALLADAPVVAEDRHAAAESLIARLTAGDRPKE
jgi:hypothetical protein